MKDMIDSFNSIKDGVDNLNASVGFLKNFIPTISNADQVLFLKGLLGGYKADEERVIDLHKRNGKPIRVSFAYLFEIIIDNKYLLVPSNHANKYQPPGGVYKISSDCMDEVERITKPHTIFKCPEDDWRKIADSEDSYRRLLELFKSGEGVDDCRFREFKEELIDTGLLDSSLFSKEIVLDSLELTRGKSDVSEGRDVNTLYGFNVYRLRLSQPQKDWIIANRCKRLEKGKYAWVGPMDINKYSGKDELVRLENDLSDGGTIQIANQTKYLN